MTSKQRRQGAERYEAEIDGAVVDAERQRYGRLIIDLGRLATDALFLAIDPYPRKSDAVFEPPSKLLDPADHPFAALKALQSDQNAAGSGSSPKGRRKTPGDSEPE